MNATMTEEGKRKAIKFIEGICEMAKTPDKSLAFVDEQELSGAANKSVCDLLRKLIHQLSDNSIMTEERKREDVDYFKRLCELVETPEEPIANLNEREDLHAVCKFICLFSETQQSDIR